MQMNKHRPLRSLLLAIPALALLTTALLPVVLAQTQDQPPAQAPTTPATGPTTTEPPGTEADSKQQPAAPDSTTSKPLKSFKPTEKIQADSAVAFPIDI